MNSHPAEKKSNPKELEKIISPILVTNNSKLKPFIELFENYPENIMLQNLGTLLGFFKINDKSEDSAYIVNFLSSVIKKEYFINHKRPVAESFDSALHKVNLALAEIAKNGNIRWIGQLDAAICVLEKNILHFTVCGTAKILLLRNQMLSDISKDLNPEELEPNPIKTFSNVSSGYLEKGDKIIITSSELFNIFSLNELKKGALRFDQEKFAQFLKTAMVNELDSASTIIVDLTESETKKEAKKAKTKPAEKEINPFDSKTFEKPVLSHKDVSSSNGEQSEYTDEKTGHIYVQGDAENPKEAGFWSSLGTSLREKIADFSYWLKNRFRKLRLILRQFGRWLKEKIILCKIKLIQKIKERRKKKEQSSQKPETKIELIEKEIFAEENIEKDGTSETLIAENVAAETVPISSKPNPILSWLKNVIENAAQWKWPKMFWEKMKKGAAKILPAFSRIKSSFLSLNYHQRVYALLTLVVILAAPVLFLKLRASEDTPVQPEPAPQISERDLILGDKNIREVSTNLSAVNSTNLKKVVLLNDSIFALSPSEITALSDTGGTEKFSLPSDFGSFSLAAPMEDLNLIFVLADSGRLISWSPISKKFQENVLSLPETRKIDGIGTYLTYLYLADSLNNQIYRFPRSGGGFGDKVDWLKDQISLSGLTDMAIEENLYLAQKNQITKLFQGKKQAFNPDPTVIPLAVSKLFTGRNISNLYVLDSQNGRVVRYTKDGLLLNQYYSEKLKGAPDFAVDEKNNKIYFVSSEGLSYFEM